ncbi:MAG: hypothetical protein ACRDMV_11040 [Streptosporangiales bacterium]
MTWSPVFGQDTLSPTAVISPAPSWPNTTGGAEGRVPPEKGEIGVADAARAQPDPDLARTGVPQHQVVPDL